MSQRRKQYLQNKKRNKKLLIAIAVFLVLIFGLGIFWSTYQKNKAKNSLESFVADDLVSLAIVDINTDSKQNSKLTELATRMGDQKIFVNYLKNLILAGISPEELKIDENTFLGWLGSQIAIGNIRVTDERLSKIFVVKVKNKELLNNFLTTFSETIEKKGYIIKKEDFRGRQLTTVSKNSSLNYVVYDDFLIVAEHLDGLKKMIDTKLGKNRSIAYDSKYKKAKNKVKNQDGIVFVYGDVLELLKVFLKTNLKLDDSVISKIKEIGDKYYASAMLSATESKILAKIYMPELSKISDNKKIKPKFANFVPDDSAFYMEGSSLKPLLVSLIVGESKDPNAQFALLSRGAKLEYGVDLSEIAELLDGQYGIYLAPDFTNEKVRLALIIDLKGKKDPAEKMKNVEGAITKLVGKYLNNDNKVDFINRKYKDTSYKIINLPKKAFDLGYYINDDKLIIFTSDKILENLKSTDKLENNSDFKDFAKSKSEQLIYIPVANLLKLSDNFGKESNEDVNSMAKLLNSVRITKNRRWSGNFVDAEIVVK